MEPFIVALLCLGVLILTHEVGHLLVAKKYNIGVLDFGIGFGPILWSVRIGETKYHLHLFCPLGGYIRPLPSKDYSVDVDIAERSSALKAHPGLWVFKLLLPSDVNDIEARSRELRALGRISPDEAPIEHQRKVLWGGITGNLLVAALLFVVGLVVLFLPVFTTNISGAANVDALHRIKSFHEEPGRVLKAAGVQIGDKVISIAGMRPHANTALPGSEYDFNYSFYANYMTKMPVGVNETTIEIAPKSAPHERLFVRVPIRDKDGYLFRSVIGATLERQVAASRGVLETIDLIGVVAFDVFINERPNNFTLLNPGGRYENPRYGNTSGVFKPPPEPTYWESVTTNFGFFRGLIHMGSDIIFQFMYSGVAFGFFSLCSQFFFLSVIVSLINILPIPGTDGYHLLLLWIEEHSEIKIPLNTRLAALSGGGYFQGALLIGCFLPDLVFAFNYYLKLI